MYVLVLLLEPMIDSRPQTETKEQGERILAGQEKFEPKKFGPGAKKQKERTGSL